MGIHLLYNFYKIAFFVVIIQKQVPLVIDFWFVVQLKYHETGRETQYLPQVGQWSMINKASTYSIFYKVVQSSV